MSIGGNSKDVLLENSTQKGAKIAQKSTLSMFQKSRHRKWVSNVGEPEQLHREPKHNV